MKKRTKRTKKQTKMGKEADKNGKTSPWGLLMDRKFDIIS